VTALSQRLYRATVGTLRIGAPARVAFEIERSVRATPNKATLKLYNLSLAHQRQIEQSGAAQVVIEVGHASTARGLEQIFRGELFRGGRGGTGASASGGAGSQPAIRSEVTPVEVVTHVEARDGGAAYQQARTARAYEPDVAIETVLRALIADVGIGAGNVDDTVAAIATTGATTFGEGFTSSGQASRELTRVLRTFGLRWSIQHGAFQALAGTTPLATQAVLLSPRTGLIGSPEPGTRGRVKARAILTPDIWPGRAVVVESARVSGRFVTRGMKSTGDSHANDWTSELELEAA
jgi:hypothetical protein